MSLPPTTTPATTPPTMNGTREWLRLAAALGLALLLLAAWIPVAGPRAQPRWHVVPAGTAFDDGGVRVQLLQLVVTPTIDVAGEKRDPTDQPRDGFVLVAALVEGGLLTSADDDGCVFTLRMDDGELVSGEEQGLNLCHNPAPRQQWLTFEVAPSRTGHVLGLNLERGMGTGRISLLRPPA